MIRVRGMLFKDGDDAFEYFRQRDLDEGSDAQRAPCGPEVLGGGICCNRCTCGGKGVCRDAA